MQINWSLWGATRHGKREIQRRKIEKLRITHAGSWMVCKQYIVLNHVLSEKLHHSPSHFPQHFLQHFPQHFPQIFPQHFPQMTCIFWKFPARSPAEFPAGFPIKMYFWSQFLTNFLSFNLVGHMWKSIKNWLQEWIFSHKISPSISHKISCKISHRISCKISCRIFRAGSWLVGFFPSSLSPLDTDPLTCRPLLDADHPKRQTPALLTEWQMLVKRLPCPKVRLRAVIMYSFSELCSLSQSRHEAVLP